MQRQSDGAYKTVAFASRTLTKVEQHYAQIEKEALALTWACQKFDDYIYGRGLHLETDHKPLVPLLSTKEWYNIPPRIQRFKMRLMPYRYTRGMFETLAILFERLAREKQTTSSISELLALLGIFSTGRNSQYWTTFS